MTKLTKVPPPSDPGKASIRASLETAVPYENMRQDTEPPVPVTSTVLPSSYNDPLPATNPFSPNYLSGAVFNNAQSTALALGAEQQPITRASEAPIHKPTPQKKSADLRQLDGKPYTSSHAPTEKTRPKMVKVATCMHDGALPPVYNPQTSEPVSPIATTSSNTQGCGKCGKRRDAHSSGQSCKDCGKRRTGVPTPTSAGIAATPVRTRAHAREISESQTSQGSSRMSGQSTAGPSSSPTSSTHSGCCTRCGRYKRPSATFNPQGRPNGSGPATVPVPLSGHPGMSPGLTIQPSMSGHNNAAYPKIDVIPPSATTYRAATMSPSSIYGDSSPLVGSATKQEFKLFRNSSIVRSLSRRLSKRDKQAVVAPSPAPLPSQQLARRSGEQSAGNLITMISTAMQDSPQSREAQYLKLQDNRPETPFSFVGGKDESDGFEMVNLHGDGASFASQESWPQEPIKPQISITHSDSDMVAGIPQDHIDVLPRPRSIGPQHLTPDDAERPPITRFRSLRQGVTRMGSGVSRSTSLRRLGSLKTVHHAWYVEGADGNNENVIPAF